MKRIVTLVAALAVWAGPALAGTRIIFQDGRSLEVESWTPSGELALLHLAGGGRISIPLAQISEVRTVAAAPVPAEAPSVRRNIDPEWRRGAGRYADLIAGAAERHDLDPALLAAMAKAESNFDPYAVSEKGACGILQLLPETGERFGVQDLFDPEQNVDGGARYLRWLLDRFDGRTDLALAAYNAGEQVVDRYGGIPPYPETRSYVSRVLADLP